ncbi:PAS domain S-box protein [Methylomonas sp. EFPC3]|uniref:EAL domain-containing protein n=1 Tax=Methylomonas sp. EFPC3 TaxID=3021710 RepID=UPI002417D0AA|nr:EAL domain-containing protein [Methylomonas sp. EFPC3]WFP52271.1 PAS domain S-box protein [Methylomonas sp. EFPC3]
MQTIFSPFSGNPLAATALALAYALAAKLAADFFTSYGTVAIIWPASGIALGGLLLAGRRYWPAVFSGALVGNLWAGSPPLVALAFAGGATVSALAGQRLLRHSPTLLQTPQDFLRLLLCGSLVSVISAFCAATALRVFELSPAGQWPNDWLHWWMADLLGIAIATPILLLRQYRPLVRWNVWRYSHGAAHLALALLAGHIVFLNWPLYPGAFGKAFYLLAFIGYGALNFGLPGVLPLVATMAMQTLLGAGLGRGYFAGVDPHSGPYLEWSYLLLCAVLGIMLALAVENHKRAELAAKSLSAFNRQILESVQQGVVVYDADGRYQLWNRFMQTLTGIGEDDCLGRTPLEKFPWLAATEVPAGIKRALKGETVYHAPFQSVDGRWLGSVQTPLRDADDRIVGVIELVKDESTQIQFGQSLSTSEARFQSILDHTPTMIFTKTPDGAYQMVNRQLAAIFGLNEDEVRGHFDADLFPAEIAASLSGNDRMVLEAGQPMIFEEQVPHRDGTLRTYLAHKFPLRTPGGDIYAVCGICTDISERKAAEKRLQESERRWKFALESGGDGVWDWDLASGQVFLSPRCMEILNFDELDARDNYRNWKASIHPEDSPKLMADLQAHLNNLNPRFSNEHRIKVDGDWRWILSRGLVIERDANGKASRMIGTHTDISKRKLLQWQQLEKIVAGAPEAALLVAASGNILLANQPAATVFGYAREVLIGRNVDDLVPFPANLNHAALRERFMRDDVARPMSANRSLAALRADGSQFPVEISLNPLEINNQHTVLVSVHDVSERKRLEREMQLMAMIHQAIGEAVMVADANNRIIAINDAFTRLTGYLEEEVIGKTTDILKSGRHSPDFYQHMWHSLLQTGHWQGEIWNKRKNGEIYHEWLVINSIYNENGELERRVAMFSEITEQKHVEQAIWRQANFDPLTDLANRRMFQDRLNQEIKKSARDRTGLAVMLLDLDRFKEVNDTLGHGMGDVLLKEAAKRLLDCVRQADTVARLGGDEFTIILGELESQADTDRVAQAILHSLSEPFRLGDELAYISVSIGITLYPQDATAAEQLMKNADQAMYSAKQQGRNRYSYFTAEMEQVAQNRMRLTNDLRQALVNGELELHYQPVVDLTTGAMHKAEALLRWRHPKRGRVSPAEFVPLAEETGLIVDIGDWVFRVAAQQVARWRASHAPDFKISINKSPVQFARHNRVDSEWLAYLQSLGLAGQAIVIEITEGLLLDADNVIRDHLYAYRDAGIQVAIDDFGTGYSSLSYLKKFDIDYLKIDQSFVRNLGFDASDLALCEAIIVMAHKLGLKVVAEGIETRQQMQLLRAAGCDYGQGHLFSKPLPAEKFADLFGNNLIEAQAAADGDSAANRSADGEPERD